MLLCYWLVEHTETYLLVNSEAYASEWLEEIFPRHTVNEKWTNNDCIDIVTIITCLQGVENISSVLHAY